MIYTFITDTDLDVGMKKYFRDQITNGVTNINILVTTESAAFSMIKTKLNNKYDLSQLFPPIIEWTASPFLQSSYCSKNNKIYKALQDTTNNDPEEASSLYWVANDPRDQLLVVYAVAITLYFMIDSINPRKLTQDLMDGFVTAIEFLDDVKEGKENPDWPLLLNGTSTILWGANPSQSHYY